VTPQTAPEVLRVLAEVKPAGPAGHPADGTSPLAVSVEGLMDQAAVQDSSPSLPGPQRTKVTRMAV
jgi:hypothetical protein